MSAEFMNQKVDPPLSGMNAMGKPIPFNRKQVAYEHCKAMGLDEARSYEVVNGMSEQLGKDKPYEAMEYGMKFLDLIGTYRVMACLLAG